MIKKITIKNFKCFKNETVLDLKKTNYKLLEQNTCGKFLKGLLFVGENASGKTSAILPLKLLLDLLFKDQEVEFVLYQCLFSKDKNTELRFEFELETHTISYFLSFSKTAIIEERLSVDDQLIIERLGGSGKLFLGSETTLHDVDKSLLFLKRVYFSTKFEGNEILGRWFDYLKKSIYINTYSKQITTYDGESLIVRKYMEAHGAEKLNEFFKNHHFNYSIQYAKMAKAQGISFTLEEEERKMIFFEREGLKISIPLFMESLGNQTLINILPAILCAVERGGLLIIDEFSSGLHNKLEELLVKYIMKNSTTTQLFFVSHSTNLLSNSLLRPDQIFSVEMTGNEGSRLNRFSDEQPRAAQNLEKMYLSGIFGGIPEYGTDKE
ncbi:MAG: ATP-binding protein [Eubacterium sp.]|nr:ATP-binding protein [Eubacterium sp.]